MKNARWLLSTCCTLGLLVTGCGRQAPTSPAASRLEKSGAGAAAAIGAATTWALPTAFSYPANPVTGPDGALWFTETGKIARITTSGALKEYALPSGHSASSLTVGPDGALWFTEPSQSAIGRITTQGAVSEFKVPGACQAGYSCPTFPKPIGIVTGSDGALWIIEPIFSRVVNRTSAAKVLRMTVGGAFTEYAVPGGTSKVTTPNPIRIARGPDGAVWFTDSFERRIWRASTSGALTSYPTTIGAPSAIAAGPDGALWFTASQLGRITTSGIVSGRPVPSGPNGATLGAIATGADGNLWVATYDLTSSAGAIVRSTTSGTLTTKTFPTYVEIDGITRGPDGAIWFTQTDNQTGAAKIGRIAT